MKTFISSLARRRYALYGMASQGAMSALFGLYFRARGLRQMQENPLMTPSMLIGLGIASIVLAAAGLIATYVIKPVAALVVPQQPQLPDVQVHKHRTPELPKAA